MRFGSGRWRVVGAGVLMPAVVGLAGCARVAERVVADASAGGGLASVVVAGKDLPGGLSEPRDAPAAAFVDARDDDCDPLARLLSAGVGGPDVVGYTTASWLRPDAGVETTVVIAAYLPGTAQRVIDDGMRALDWCYAFAPASGGSFREPQCVAVPAAGDRTLGLRLTDPAGGGATGYTVVLVGDVVAVFAQDDPTGTHAAMPDDGLVREQVARIRAELS